MEFVGIAPAGSRTPYFPLAMCTAGEPMDGLGGLDDAKLLGPMALPVVVNEGRNAEIDGDNASMQNASFSKSGKGHLGFIVGRLPPQVHGRINKSRSGQNVVDFPPRNRIMPVFQIRMPPLFGSFNVGLQVGRLISFVPVRPVACFMLNVVAAVK